LTFFVINRDYFENELVAVVSTQLLLMTDFALCSRALETPAVLEARDFRAFHTGRANV